MNVATSERAPYIQKVAGDTYAVRRFDVAVDVSDIKPVRGRGIVTHECTALVEIGGIHIFIHGITLRNDRPRKVSATLSCGPSDAQLFAKGEQ